MSANILVIDSPSGKLCSKVSECESWNCIFADNLEDALKNITETQIHLILANEIHCEDFLQEILKHVEDNCSHVVTLVVSSAKFRKSVINSLSLGVLDFIPDSASSQELIATITRLLTLSLPQRNHNESFSCCKLCNLEFELSNDQQQIVPLISFLRRSIQSMTKFNEREINRITVSLDEVLLNAIIHGNLEVESDLRWGDGSKYREKIAKHQKEEPYVSRTVSVKFQIDSNAITIQVNDQGPGYNPNAVVDPTDLENIDRPFGRGLLLIRAFMDDVVHNDKGNEVTLVKYR